MVKKTDDASKVKAKSKFVKETPPVAETAPEENNDVATGVGPGTPETAPQNDNNASAKKPGRNPRKTKKASAPETEAAQEEPEVTAPQDTAQEKEAPEEKKDISDSKYAKKATNHTKFFNEHWGVAGIDPMLEEVLAEAKKTKDGRIKMTLTNGRQITFYPEIANRRSEFIGYTDGVAKKFDEVDAKAIVATAKSRKWETITVYGTTAQKEMMWLEAQTLGLAVTNFEPTADSKIRQKLAERQTPEQNITGVTPGHFDLNKLGPFDNWLDQKIETSKDAAEIAGLSKVRSLLTLGTVKFDEKQQGEFYKAAETSFAAGAAAFKTIAGIDITATAPEPEKKAPAPSTAAKDSKFSQKPEAAKKPATSFGENVTLFDRRLDYVIETQKDPAVATMLTRVGESMSAGKANMSSDEKKKFENILQTTGIKDGAAYFKKVTGVDVSGSAKASAPRVKNKAAAPA